MANVHIVNHTHWDREWYFTSMDALVLSDQLFSDVIEELTRHPEASFVLDGQLSILDDYLELYPEKMQAIQKLVANKQLFIGPWFTQTDAFFTSGESVLRNGMIGIFEAKKYGEHMPIGYLPDTFGFNAQMPAVLSELGFESIIMWRGLNFEKHVPTPYFKWRDLARNNTLYAVNFPQGYSTGMLLEPTQEYLEGRLEKGVDFIKKYTDGEIIIPSGNDQLDIISDFTNKVEQLNKMGKYTYKVSSYPAFLEAIKQEDLPTYQGELREPVLGRVHKTIGSVRANLKQSIFKLEDKLIYRLEPMLVIAQNLGITLSNRLLIKAWKKLLECQAHDSLAGCVSDSVAQDIAHRLKEADEIADSMENIVLKRISQALGLTQQDILVLNPSPKAFNGQKIVQVVCSSPTISFEGHTCTVLKSKYIESRENIVEETPAGNRFITEPGYYMLTVSLSCSLLGLGYKVFHFEESQSMDAFEEIKSQEISASDITLSFKNNILSLLFGNTKIENFISLVDEGNAGDTYDFSPLLNYKPLVLSFSQCCCFASGAQQKMVLHGNKTLPYSLQERENKQNTTPFSYTVTLTLTKHGELQGHIAFKNTVLNHRLRLQLNMPQPIQFALAGLPYGFIKRKNVSVKNWQESYLEAPVNIEPFEKTVAVYTQNTSLGFFTANSKEYEYDNNALFITILATTDTLGKPDLIYRPGRASGDTTKKGHIMMDTPLAQMENEPVDFYFNIAPRNHVLSQAQLASFQETFVTPSIAYQEQSLNYFVYRIDNKIQKRIKPLSLTNTEYSILNINKEEQNNIWVASVYNAYYHENAFVVRLQNPTNYEQNVPVKKLFKGFNVRVINAIEQEDPKQNTDTFLPYSMKTLLLEKKS